MSPRHSRKRGRPGRLKTPFLSRPKVTTPRRASHSTAWTSPRTFKGQTQGGNAARKCQGKPLASPRSSIGSRTVQWVCGLSDEYTDSGTFLRVPKMGDKAKGDLDLRAFPLRAPEKKGSKREDKFLCRAAKFCDTVD